MYKSFNECLEQRSKEIGDTIALEFLPKGDGQAQSLTYSELVQRSGELAHELRQRNLVGKTALLLYPSSLDYLIAFFGCLFAGVIAVPAYPPKNNHHARRMDSIIHDSNVALVMTHSSISEKVKDYLNLEFCLETDSVRCDSSWINTQVDIDDVAYLQYTSGSTGNPKGVMVTHKNMLENCRLYARGVGIGNGGCHVSWLPLFHDMGLVQGILLPLWLKATAVFMPPEKFIQKPERWVKVMSEYRAIMTGGPNFAYDLCANRVTDEDIANLDLSTWKVAVNGAEPVHKKTLDKFIERFSAAHYSPATFYPGYGMAETTLYVTAGDVDSIKPTISWVDEHKLKSNQLSFLAPIDGNAKAMVACGKLYPETLVKIVDPDTKLELSEHCVGEIWVSGDIVCKGYWNKESATEQTFKQMLSAYPGKTFLRTGDLGFIKEQQLYITGRIKDVIIVRGENHYPQDIEATVENVSEAFRKGGFCAAFTVEIDNQEELIVVQEVERTKRKNLNIASINREVAKAVFMQHGLNVYDLVLVLPGETLKTSSGKIQRSGCKQKYLDSAYATVMANHQVEELEIA